MYQVKITFPSGPTIMEGDATPVEIRRMAMDPKQASELQEAALTLGAIDVLIEKVKR